MILPSFPLNDEVVEKSIIPLDELIADPFIMQYFIVFVEADSINWIVDAEVPVLILVIVRSFILGDVPPTLPSIVTLDAPLKSIRGPSISPSII